MQTYTNQAEASENAETVDVFQTEIHKRSKYDNEVKDVPGGIEIVLSHGDELSDTLKREDQSERLSGES